MTSAKKTEKADSFGALGNRVPLPPFRPVQNTTLQANIYAELNDAVMKGRFAPGQSITLRELAKAFDVSTMPVRGAVHQLIADGAFEFTSSRAVAVPRMSRDKLMDLQRVRMTIEGRAAEWAAANITAEEINLLRKLSVEYDVLNALSDDHTRIYEHLAKTKDFRFTIYRSARSPTMIGIIETLWLKIAPYFNLFRGDWTPIAEKSHHYRAIVIEALEARNAEVAKQAIENEIYQVGKILGALLEKKKDDRIQN